MTKSLFKTYKKPIIAICALIALVCIYFISMYYFAFIPTFGRSSKIHTEKTEIEFFAGEENYKQHLSDVEYINSLNLPRIETESADGLKLKAILWEADKDCQGTALLMHGYQSMPLREFASIARIFHNLDFNVVLPFHRAHGESEGKYTTFAQKERYDVREWIFKVNALYGQDLPVFLMGISMGSSSVTMAAGLELPPNVRGVIADCGFTDSKEIVYWTLSNKYHLWPGVAKIVLKTFSVFCRKSANFDLSGCTTFDALNKTYLPFLFITGTADKTVPHEMTMSNFLLYKQRHPDSARLVVIENAPHAVSYMIDKERYKNEIIKFVKKYGAK